MTQESAQTDKKMITQEQAQADKNISKICESYNTHLSQESARAKGISYSRVMLKPCTSQTSLFNIYSKIYIAVSKLFLLLSKHEKNRITRTKLKSSTGNAGKGSSTGNRGSKSRNSPIYILQYIGFLGVLKSGGVFPMEKIHSVKRAISRFISKMGGYVIIKSR